MRKLLKRLACEGILAFFFFPSQNQADDAGIALSAAFYMVASQIEFEEEILGGIQYLASFALPVLAVAFQQPDYLRTDMFQIFLTFLFAENIEYII